MLEEPNIYDSQFQVLSTEADADQKKDKSGKALNEKVYGSHKDRKVKSSSETHVELDSRLLSALLTVSISDYSFYVKVTLYRIFLLAFPIVVDML
jgi:hypothetical protein